MIKVCDWKTRNYSRLLELHMLHYHLSYLIFLFLDQHSSLRWSNSHNYYTEPFIFQKKSSFLTFVIPFSFVEEGFMFIVIFCKIIQKQKFQELLIILFLIYTFLLAKLKALADIHNLVCLFCLGPEETHSHLFLSCSVVEVVWHQIMD